MTKSSNDNTNTINITRRLREKASAKKIQQLYKNKKVDFEQGEHTIQIIYNITTKGNADGEATTRPYNTKVFHAHDG